MQLRHSVSTLRSLFFKFGMAERGPNEALHECMMPLNYPHIRRILPRSRRRFIR
jgi:hypothetical protein